MATSACASALVSNMHAEPESAKKLRHGMNHGADITPHAVDGPARLLKADPCSSQKWG